MKKLSKILCWLLTLAMLAAMCPTAFAVEDGVVSPYYGITEGMLGKIQPGTEESTLLSRLLYRGQVTVNDGVKTGSTLSLEDGTSLTLVVQGDCNGDGNFTLSDFLKVKSLLLSLEEFSPAQTQAGDLSGDGRLTLTDFLQMKSILLGQSDLACQPIAGSAVADTVLLTVGETLAFGSGETAEIEGDAITWESGIITAQALGTARITVGEESTLVTVCEEAPTVSFKKPDVAVGPGSSVKLETVLNHPIKQKVTYSVSDETIATVDENGILTGHTEGTATVTAMLPNGATATQTLTVIPLIEDICIAVPYSMKVKIGGSKQLSVSALPASSPEKLIWASSDPSIATVDETGLVQGLRAGYVTITCTSEFGKVQAAVEMKVCNLVQVALTFDDGPSGKLTPQLLDLLQKYDIRATFFMVGKQANYYPGIVKRIADDGHELGYHSWDHTLFTQVGAQKIKDEYTRFQALLTEICGRQATVFRAPGGGITNTALTYIQLPHIYWSIDTKDWQTRNTAKVKSAILEGLKDGAIILLHDIHDTTISGTQAALEYIFENDLDVEFLTVTELLSRDGTPPTPGKTYYNG
jgi:peptidoglycan/xylan/chitin deacetylase (PgdA/CDA1 family)